jgi:hypothetical protein
MGDFRIIIDAVGGHGQDRSKKDGERVNFAEGGASAPEVIAKALVSALIGSGCSVQSAKVIHWPADNYEGRDPEKQIVDDLLTGVRKGHF